MNKEAIDFAQKLRASCGAGWGVQKGGDAYQHIMDIQNAVDDDRRMKGDPNVPMMPLPYIATRLPDNLPYGSILKILAEESSYSK